MNNENEQSMTTMSGGSLHVSKRTAYSVKSDWLVPAGLIALTFIPVAAGVARLVGLAGAAPITPDNARFFAMPLPVIIHIISASIFCVLGAFQFSPGFRRRRPGWHRAAGRILIPSGIAAALSGLWMTQFYPLAPHIQGEVLHAFRLFIGSFMIVSIALSLAAILRRDISQHRAWIMRGYAIAQGAGTQALISILWLVLFGAPDEFGRDMLLIAGWLINLAVAEWIIQSKATGKQPRHPVTGKNLPVSGLN